MTDLNPVGAWEKWYSMLDSKNPEPYGVDSPTYDMGADWLKDCGQIEDWGCGKGWFRRFIPAQKYRGVDGSHSPFADEVVDLAEYTSSVEGIFLRHVLEHDFRWRRILDNALRSFTKRMMLVLFTPLSEATHDIEWEEDPGVPNLSFALKALTDPMDSAGVDHSELTFDSRTKFGTETVIWMKR